MTRQWTIETPEPTVPPEIDSHNIMEMAACMMGKYDHIGFTAAKAKLTDPNCNLLRDKWLPIATVALEHFEFLQRPIREATT